MSRVAFLSSTVLLLSLSAGAALTAQELRQTRGNRLAPGSFVPSLGRVVMPGIGGYSREWDGTSLSYASDIGSPYNPYLTWTDQSGRLMTLRANYDPTPGAPPVVAAFRDGLDWVEIPTLNPPALRFGCVLAYDLVRDEVVVFGGLDSSLLGTAETWVFDGLAWSLRTPLHSPPPRWLATAAYDPTRQRVVLFGGSDGAVSPAFVTGDTWEWDGTDWAQAAPLTIPNARTNGSMAYDAGRQTMMMVGGWDDVGLLLDDHWEYDGVDWNLVGTIPSGTVTGSLVYDPARTEMVLLASATTVAYSAAIHTYDGVAWALRLDLGDAPIPDENFALAVDPTGSRLLRFGGWSSNSPGADTLWQWDGSTWTALANGGPAGRINAAMWSLGNATYLFGGHSLPQLSSLFTDTWKWDGIAWSLVGTGPVNSSGAPVVAMPTQGAAIGLFDNGQTWSFDGVAWQQLTTQQTPSAWGGFAMAYDAARDRIVLYGGVASTPGGPVPLFETWEFDGTDWSWVPTIANPPTDLGTMAYDAALQRVVFAPAGFGEIALWQFDGTDWSPLPAEGAAGSSHALFAASVAAATGPSGRAHFAQFVDLLELVPLPARAASYGTACTSGAPTLTTRSRPRLGDAQFAVEVTTLPPGNPAVLLGATSQISVPALGCTLLVLLNEANALLLAGVNAQATQPLPVPATPTLLGAELFFQAAALSALAPAGLTLTRGLAVTLGD